MTGIHQHDVATSTVLRFASVSKRYGTGSQLSSALDDVSVSFARSALTAVMGTSGSGKSTLLQCAAGLELPTSGEVFIGTGTGATATAHMTETQLARLRRDQVGFVFQSYNLLPSLPVRDNVALPLRLASRRSSRRQAEAMLDRVGMGHWATTYPQRLSGGQQQRVAIARALVTDPELILADEPTGALDLVTAREVMALLRSAVEQWNRSVVMVTHDPLAAAYADTIVFLRQGRVADVSSSMSPGRVARRLTELAR